MFNTLCWRRVMLFEILCRVLNLEVPRCPVKPRLSRQDVTEYSVFRCESKAIRIMCLFRPNLLVHICIRVERVLVECIQVGADITRMRRLSSLWNKIFPKCVHYRLYTGFCCGCVSPQQVTWPTRKQQECH